MKTSTTWLILLTLAAAWIVGLQAQTSPAPTGPVVQTAPAAGSPAPRSNGEVTLQGSEQYEKSLSALTMLFVLAVLLENAFALLFSWRLFLTYCSLRGMRSVIMFLIALAVVIQFHVDIVSSLIAAYRGTVQDSTPLSKVITAMILAGGSSSVNRIMVALGFRRDPAKDEQQAKPPQDKAWVAIRVRLEKAADNVVVQIRSLGPAANDATAPLPVAGTVDVHLPDPLELLFSMPRRFPPSGGHVLLPDNIYEIRVEGTDKDGGLVTGVPAGGPKFVFAPGAIVNFDVTL